MASNQDIWFHEDRIHLMDGLCIITFMGMYNSQKMYFSNIMKADQTGKHTGI